MFRDQEIEFANGARGVDLEIESAGPRNYHHVISAPDALPKTVIDAKLFPPRTDDFKRNGLAPAVVIVPGSLGVAPSHLAHAETFTDMGLAALVVDPFGRRGVSSTVANQTQYAFAASAYDVLAAVATLSKTGGIDAERIGAQGHSRGGAAVLTAAMRRFASAVLESGPQLRGVYAAYPWSGHQFLDPDVGPTRVRAVIGDRDDWCLPQQVQGHIQAIRLRGGQASMRLFADCAHSFDRETPIERIEEASVAPGAPTAYIADDGAFILPTTGQADPALVDRDLMMYAIEAGYGVRGATYGAKPGQAEAFKEDMVAFWRGVFA